MSQPCSYNDMAGTSTPYPPDRTGRRAGIGDRRNVPEEQEHQGLRLGTRDPLNGSAF